MHTNILYLADIRHLYFFVMYDTIIKVLLYQSRNNEGKKSSIGL